MTVMQAAGMSRAKWHRRRMARCTGRLQVSVGGELSCKTGIASPLTVGGCRKVHRGASLLRTFLHITPQLVLTGNTLVSDIAQQTSDLLRHSGRAKNSEDRVNHQSGMHAADDAVCKTTNPHGVSSPSCKAHSLPASAVPAQLNLQTQIKQA